MKAKVQDLWRSVEGVKPLEVPIKKLTFDPMKWVEGFPDDDSLEWLSPAWIVEHAQRIQDADLNYPIIIKSRGWEILDGSHRLAKALLLKRETIFVVRADPEWDDVFDVFEINHE